MKKMIITKTRNFSQKNFIRLEFEVINSEDKYYYDFNFDNNNCPLIIREIYTLITGKDIGSTKCFKSIYTLHYYLSQLCNKEFCVADEFTNNLYY